jgi:hypothetical protein
MLDSLDFGVSAKNAAAVSGETGYSAPKCASSTSWDISVLAAALELLDIIQSSQVQRFPSSPS